MVAVVITSSEITLEHPENHFLQFFSVTQIILGVLSSALFLFERKVMYEYKNKLLGKKKLTYLSSRLPKLILIIIYILCQNIYFRIIPID